MRKIFIALSCCCATLLPAQTPQSGSSPADKFLNSPSGTFEQALVVDSLPMLLQWHERQSSFSGEGIRTFVGSSDGASVAYLSIDRQGNVIGNLHVGKGYDISGEVGNIQVIPTRQAAAHCGLSKNESPHAWHQHAKNEGIGANEPHTAYGDIPSLGDGVFRHYRLAVFMSYSEVMSPKYKGDVNKIKAFWAELETYLNDIYVRDLGVHLTIINNEKLIETKWNGVYTYRSGNTLIDSAIGNDAYDLGVVLDYSEGQGINGLAHLGGVRQNRTKAWAIVTSQQPSTIAHELGHMFGADHPFTKGAGLTGLGTEPASGQSIVSYGYPYRKEFVSLESLRHMQVPVSVSDGRITDKHTVPTNTAPHIDRTKMKTEYRVPKGTYFTLPVYASDKEQEVLNYYFNQYGCSRYSPATFPVFPPQNDPVLSFGQRLTDGLGFVANSDKIPVGNYRFWLAVSDALPTEQAIEKRQAPLFDSFIADVKVVEAIPFKITSEIDSRYSMGRKVHLTWGVDKTFFPSGSRVRIVMSDDMGKTYSHVLMPSTENDGECDVYIPQHVMEKVPTYSHTIPETGERIDIYFAGKGIIRIETIDDDMQYYDLTNQNPNGGGIEVVAAKVSFEGLPGNLYVRNWNGTSLPETPHITAKADGKELHVDYTEQTQGILTTRTWTTSYEGQEYGVRQFIEHTGNDIPTHIQTAAGSSVKVEADGRRITLHGIQQGDTASLCDLSGKQVSAVAGTGAAVTINVSRPGMFLLCVNGVVVSKLLVQ